MAQQFGQQNRQQQAFMYYARQRLRARAEATAGEGGLREQTELLGLIVTVVLTTEEA